MPSPAHDQVRMNLVFAGNLSNRHLSLHSLQRHLGFENFIVLLPILHLFLLKNFKEYHLKTQPKTVLKTSTIISPLVVKVLDQVAVLAISPFRRFFHSFPKRIFFLFLSEEILLINKPKSKSSSSKNGVGSSSIFFSPSRE